MVKEIKEVAEILIDRDIRFNFNINEIIIGKRDTGYYGEVESSIKWNYYKDDKYTLHHAYKGYPQFDSFDKAEDLVSFIEKYEK